jgi:hypothetical protein
MILALSLLALLQCPMHSDVDARHDTLGMSHELTHHNFRILEDGGAIELHANDSADSKSIAAIRAHLTGIAAAFSKADFSTPKYVHHRTPDGVDRMRRFRKSISYQYEELPDGARVRITAKGADALDAVHDFLRFQISDHHTGD